MGHMPPVGARFHCIATAASRKQPGSSQRVDRLDALAKQLALSQAALREVPTLSASFTTFAPVTQPFADPDPFHELTFRSALDAKRAIADRLGMPLAKLAPEQLAALNTLLNTTLAKQTVWDHVRQSLEPFYRG